MISDEEKDQVRAASDLVAIVQETVELKPRGHEFWGCCPFHGEKTPSFHIIPATQVWHCFGCGEGGDVFTYIMKRENLSFPESIRYLADRAGIELHDTGAYRERGTKRARIYDLCAETAHINVDECGAPARMTGCAIVTIPTTDGKLTPELIRPHLK